MRWPAARPSRRSRPACLCAAAALLAGCAGAPLRDGPPAGGHLPPPYEAVTPQPEQRSRYGNGPVYEVFGQRYTVMESSAGYSERGVASWYGQKFHGRLTASREPYDMYAMTAAHKTLPLPTWVRVRNLKNGKSVVVRVNDRGPFVHNRIIDLSYAAASALDLVGDGTGLVEVTALEPVAPRRDYPRRSARALPAPPTPPEPERRVYVQVGAFGSRVNAERRRALLASGGIDTATIVHDAASDPALHRVRIGPIGGVDDYDGLVAKLALLGIDDPYLVAE